MRHGKKTSCVKKSCKVDTKLRLMHAWSPIFGVLSYIYVYLCVCVCVQDNRERNVIRVHIPPRTVNINEGCRLSSGVEQKNEKVSAGTKRWDCEQKTMNLLTLAKPSHFCRFGLCVRSIQTGHFFVCILVWVLTIHSPDKQQSPIHPTTTPWSMH